MQDIYFGMTSQLDSGDRMCQVPDVASGYAVYDALCAKFCVVVWYDEDGKVIRRYDNTPRMD